MNLVKTELEEILYHLDSLEETTQPIWGKMSAQRMIEHLSDTLRLAKGELNVQLEIPEDKVEKAKQFIHSEHPMPKNFEAIFAPEIAELRNESIDLAVDEFTINWIEFILKFEEEPTLKTLHPNFGMLSFEDWTALNKKHITHHLTQFGLL